MQTITPKELLKRFNEVTSSKIVTIVMNTEVKLLKKNRDTKEPCPYVGVRKRTRCTVMLGTDYENGVNNRRDKEGEDRNFEAQPHAWAEHTDKPVISTNKAGDQSYANVRLLETHDVEYTMDGKEIDREALRPFQSPKKPPKNQGVEKPVEWRNVSVFPKCSFESIKSDGELIEVAQ
jgi:hypothetical protein